MKQETWRRVDETLADALELPAEERGAFVAARLGDDAEAEREARKLVAQAEAAERLFETSPVASLSGLSAGSRLGPWELVRPLGSGGMGIVWLARRVDGQATMQAAIKLLPPALAGPLRGDQDLFRRFLLEKQILARLQHPNIARLLDASAGAGDAPNFVMEYVEGRPLMEALRGGSYTTEERLRMFLKICEAVAYAHANLIIHRDLKPQNVMVTEAGEPKLLDFGIAKMLNDPAGDASVTLRRAFSLDYASPEQIRGETVSTLADVYALGLMLYEMVSGERARRWSDLALGQVVEEAGRFVIPAHAKTPADLLAVMRKASTVEPGMRYRSVSELAADVERWLDGRPVEARATGLGYQVICFARRNWMAVGVGTATLATIVGLGAWGWISAQRAEAERGVALEKSRQLETALAAEREARQDEAAERRRAEEQTRLAREMSEVAGRREAEAEQRMKDLLRMFEEVLRTTRSDVAKLAGGTKASATLLENVLAKLGGLKGSRQTEPLLKELRAAAHAELGELYGGRNSNLGDVERGKREREKALQLWAELRQSDPTNMRWARAYWEAKFQEEYLRLPKIGTAGGEAWLEYEKRWMELAKRAGNDAGLNRAVGNYYFWRARVHGSEVASYEKALDWFGRNLEGQSARPLVLRDLAIVHKYLATADPRLERKLLHAGEALRFDRQRVETDAADANARIDLGYSVVAYGDALARQRDWKGAWRHYREGYEMRKALAQADPQNLFVRRSLVYPNRERGLVALRLAEWGDLNAVIEELEWQRKFGVKMEASDEGLFAYLAGRLEEANGGDGCGSYRKVREWEKKMAKPNPQLAEPEVQSRLRRCAGNATTSR